MHEVMNLSNDINVITAEIKSYQQIAGQSIFEIGRRLKHVKENDLAHGEYGKWLEGMGIDRTLATRLMKVSSEFNLNYATSHNLGLNVLYEIATLQPEQRDKPHTILSTGEEKTVDEMTVRELREVKKALKEKEKQLQQETEKRKRAEQETFAARKSEQLTRKQLEELEGQEPQIVEREVVKEVEIESKEHINVINELKNENKELYEKVRFYQKQAESLQQENEELKQDYDTTDYLPEWSVNTFCYELDEFTKAFSFSSKQMALIMAASPEVKAHIYRSMVTIQTLAKECKNFLDKDLDEFTKAFSFSSKQMALIMAASPEVKAHIYRSMVTIQTLAKECKNSLDNDIINV
ncbi:hypothetical protein [Bacillus thuringiensis]|uniref:hypothetical protein n=1 Tax=Bacillus thuringiensis TaxID=1428 RepID=UPI003337D81B